MKLRLGATAVALLALSATPALADPTCGGSSFQTCASVVIESSYADGNYLITMTVTNPLGNNSNFHSIGLHNLPAGTTFTAGTITRNGSTDDVGFAFSTPGLNGEGIQPIVYGVGSSQGNSNALTTGETLVFTFTISGLPQGYSFDDWAIHGISGPNGCSTKLVVTNGQANAGPYDEKCGDVPPPETVVPEPSSVVLLATGLLALVGGGAVRNRRKRSTV